MLKIHAPALHESICPCTYSFRNKNALVEIPGCWEKWLCREPASCLPICPGSLHAVLEQESWAAQMLLLLPRQASCPSVKAWNLHPSGCSPRSQAGCGRGQPHGPGAGGSGLGGHPCWGLPRSLTAPESGSQEPGRWIRWQVTHNPA